MQQNIFLNIIQKNEPDFLTFISNYDRYIVDETYSTYDKICVLGAKYFTIDLSFDEIMLLFQEIVTNFGRLQFGDLYTYIKFFLVHALYKEKITRDKAIELHRKYFNYQRKDNLGSTIMEITDFTKKV
jgi:hypothetical protein